MNNCSLCNKELILTKIAVNRNGKWYHERCSKHIKKL